MTGLRQRISPTAATHEEADEAGDATSATSTSSIDLRTRVLASLPVLRELSSERAAVHATERIAFGLAAGLVLAVWGSYAWALGFLCDDAYVSFRYARNLLAGNGLVWNVGERVEGYTNFLWVLEVAALEWLFRIPPQVSSVALSVASTLLVFWVTAKLAASTPFGRDSGRVRALAMLIALALLAVNRNFAVWTSSGLETRQFTWLIVAAVLLLRRADAGPLRYVPASLVFGLAELTRPEANLFFACACVYVAGESLLARSFSLRELLGLALPYVLIVGAHTAFRFFYYGEIVPNTYYAKDVGPWLEGGAAYLVVAIVENGLYLVWPVACLGLIARLVLKRDGLHVLSLLMLTAHWLYLVRIGGDHFELRPLDVHWPLLALATTDGLFAIAAGGKRLATRYLPDFAEVARYCTLAVAGLLLVAYATLVQLAQQVTTYGLTSRGETVGLISPLHPSRFAPAYLLPGVEHLSVPYNAALAYTGTHSIGLRWAEHRAFHRQQATGYEPYLPYVEGLFPKDAVMSDGTIGVTGYVLWPLTIIDTHGLTDRTVARNPVTVAARDRQMAHDRNPPPGYLAERGVNLEVLPSKTRFDASSGYALKLSESLWMPLTSTKREWLERAFAHRKLWRKSLTPKLENNRILIDGESFTPSKKLGFFDDGKLDGWKPRGGALKKPRGAVSGKQSPIAGAIGGSLANSFHPEHGDAVRGSLTSPQFVPVAGEHLVFLVGGGKGPKVGVELRVEDRAVATYRGLDSEMMFFEAIDLSPYAGKSCRIRIVDGDKGPWGHVLADHFMLVRRGRAKDAAPAKR